MSDQPIIPTHAVLYTDGGCDSPTAAGWGMHGYLYVPEAAKQGTGNPKALPTKAGYKMGESGKPDITLVNYVDAFGAILHSATNNVAELKAGIGALKLVKEYNINEVVFMMDSKYVIDGFDKYMYNWQKSNWVKNDGQPVANTALWKEMYALKTELITAGVKMRTQWVKGHSGELGNDRADAMATAGKMAARNGVDREMVKISDAKGFWSPKSERNRMLNHPNWFFMAQQDCPQPTGDGRFAYHIGTVRDNIDLIGKPIADASFAVIYAKERDPVLDHVAGGADDLYTGRPQGVMVAYLDTIFKPAVYDQINDFGRDLLIRDRRDRRLSTKMNRNIQGEVRTEVVPVLHEADPPGLSFRLMTMLGMLEDKLNEYLRPEPRPGTHIRKTDITSILYEGEKSAKKGAIKLKKTVSQGLTSLKVEVTYRQDSTGEDKTIPVVLTLAQDLPDRNTLSALAAEDVKATVLTWPESSRAIRFAVVIESNGDVGIWSGPYSNLQMLPIK